MPQFYLRANAKISKENAQKYQLVHLWHYFKEYYISINFKKCVNF